MVDEVVLRQHIMARLAEVTQANGGFVSRQEISSFTTRAGYHQAARGYVEGHLESS